MTGISSQLCSRRCLQCCRRPRSAWPDARRRPRPLRLRPAWPRRGEAATHLGSEARPSRPTRSPRPSTPRCSSSAAAIWQLLRAVRGPERQDHPRGEGRRPMAMAWAAPALSPRAPWTTWACSIIPGDGALGLHLRQRRCRESLVGKWFMSPSAGHELVPDMAEANGANCTVTVGSNPRCTRRSPATASRPAASSSKSNTAVFDFVEYMFEAEALEGRRRVRLRCPPCSWCRTSPGR